MDNVDATEPILAGVLDAMDRAGAERTYADYLAFKREEPEYWVFTVKPREGLDVDESKEVRVRKRDGRVHLQSFVFAASNRKKRAESWTRLFKETDERLSYIDTVTTLANNGRGSVRICGHSADTGLQRSQ
eukprot:jgi/Mesvir1/18626/Mv17135-RA.1